MALGVQYVLWSVIDPYAWFLFFPAIFASAWLGGVRAGITSTIGAVLTVWWLFIPPRYQFSGIATKQVLPIVIFTGMGVALSLFRERLRTADRQTREALAVASAANEELLAANEEITELYEKTREIEELKSQFFANVSHELRTPLALILGQTGQLRAALAGDAECDRQLEVVDRNARVLLRHVADLLDSSRLEAGVTVPEYRDFDLAEVVRIVTSYFEGAAAQRRITFTVRADEPVPLQADPEMVQRTITNLVANAVKFTPDDGVIRVEVNRDAADDVVTLEVADSGIGIGQEDRELVFERFRQIDGGTTRRFGGTGLGLSLVRDFVRLHGGSVSVADAPEGGALLRVELPARAPAGTEVAPARRSIGEVVAERVADEPLPAPPTCSPMPVGPGPIVLVIEDDPDLNRFIADVLADTYRVEVARDGRTGLELARRVRPALVLCDVMMPGMSGEEVVSAMHADPELTDIPIVILTAKADEELRIRLLQSGASDHLVKPFSVPELRARVANLVVAAQAREKLRAGEIVARDLAEVRRSAEQYLRALLDAAPDAMVVAGADGTIRLVNRRAEELFGYQRDELVGQRVEILIPESRRARHVGLRAGFAQSPDTRPMGAGIDLVGRRKDGTEVAIDVSLSPFAAQGDSLVIAAVRDITERRQMEDRLRQHAERFRATFHDAPIGMAIADLRPHRAHAWIDVNDELARTLGRSREELMELGPEGLASPDDSIETGLDLLASGAVGHHEADRRYRHAEGHDIWTHVSASVVTGPDGAPELAILHIEDITARRRAAEQLAHDALHDPLTGLPNRTLLLDRVAQLLAGLERSSGLLALLYIDLDGFKHVNDTFGHAAGDELLAEIARRIAAVIRPTDTAARMAGDEFVIVCPDLHDEQEAFRLARRVADALDGPVDVGTNEAAVSASIGIALAHDAGRSPAALLREADAAMYRAKRHGRRRVELFDGSAGDVIEHAAQITADLRDALANGWLRLHYQPVVDLDDGRIRGLEALLRIEHPTRGLLLPDQFLATAEGSGLIVPIGGWVLQEACRQLVAWERGTAPALVMSVNVSSRQVMHGDLGDLVEDAIRTSGIDPRQLCLELTESVFADGSPPVSRTLRRLREHGIRLAIDDFGTGYSSLAYLKRFPVDLIKIDRGFIAGLDLNANDTAIVEAIAGLGQSLDLIVVAEGVESAAQVVALQRLGCSLAQGWLFSAAVEPEQLTRLLQDGTPYPTSPAIPG